MRVLKNRVIMSCEVREKDYILRNENLYKCVGFSRKAILRMRLDRLLIG